MHYGSLGIDYMDPLFALYSKMKSWDDPHHKCNYARYKTSILFTLYFKKKCWDDSHHKCNYVKFFNCHIFKSLSYSDSVTLFKEEVL